MPYRKAGQVWRRLSFKLFVSLTVIVTLGAGMFALFHIETQKRRLLETMILGADQLSKSITSATWHAMLADQRSAAYEIMRKIAEKQGIDRIRIFNREGRVMFSTRAGDTLTVVDRRSEVCQPCHSGKQAKADLTIRSRVRLVNSPDGQRTLTMVTPIYNEPSCSQASCHAHAASLRVLGLLDLSLRLDPVAQEEANIRNQVAASTLVQIVVIALFLVVFVRQFVVLPIRELIAGTKAVSAMDLDSPIAIRHRSLEMDSLVDSFNAMRVRLRGALDEVKQFTQELETKVDRRTEQLKAAQHKLMQNDRLASLGQLAASVAHEINNPVAGILNLSKLMQRIMTEEGVPKGREDEFRKYLAQVASETARVGRIVSDLLAFSRRSKPQHVPSDLNSVVQRTVSLIDYKLRLANTRAEVVLAPDLPPLLCDPSQIQQVILNLLLNASEATAGRDAGLVRIETGLGAGGQTLNLIVTDNGEGIAPENLNRVFDPFFTTKAEGKGVGLGLSVLYGIVRAHNGDVEVTSNLGAGTRFVVTLPLNAAERPEDSF
jgi:two-component system NtrC family sensor kinase